MVGLLLGPKSGRAKWGPQGPNGVGLGPVKKIRLLTGLDLASRLGQGMKKIGPLSFLTEIKVVVESLVLVTTGQNWPKHLEWIGILPKVE